MFSLSQNTEIECDIPPKVERSQMVLTDQYVGSSVQYVCVSGFMMQGDVRLVCNLRGEWEGTVPSCDSKCVI